MANKPVLHRRDHEHGGADPVRIVWESTGTGGGIASFGGGSNPTGFPGAATTNITFTRFTESSGATVFDQASGFVLILIPGLYQIVVEAEVRFGSIPTGIEEAILYPRVYDAGLVELGFSLEATTDQLEVNHVIFPPGVNRFRYPQRIMPLSITDAVSYPVTIKPEVTLTDHTLLRVNQFAVWGFRIGSPLASSMSD